MTAASGARAAALGAALVTAAACASSGSAEGEGPAPACRSDDAPLQWALAGAERQGDLDRWCAAVGAPRLLPLEAPRPKPPSAPGEGPPEERSVPSAWSSLLVVSWNMNGANGDLGRLLADLRAGRFGRADATIVFLQEAPRRDASVPSSPPRGSRWGKRLGSGEAPSRASAEVGEQARRHGLGLVYVPSMRNGVVPADRGNAILSSLPLRDPWSVELPLERDRRVAVSAEIPAAGVRRFRVTALHLDHMSEWSRIGRSFGRGRTAQMSALLEALPWHDGGLLAGDFNAWHSQEGEPAVRLARRVYPSMESIPDDATVTGLWGLARRRVDFMLARLPDEWQAGYQVWPDRYGSDHHPLVGVVEVARDGAPRAP